MNIKEMLQMVDHWVFAETDQHLDDLQKTIIEEISQGKTYKQIADLYGYHENYVGDESRKLFKILSEKLGENINKQNFGWTFERVTDNFQGFNFVNGNLNLCHNNQTSNNNNNSNYHKQKSNFYDLTFAPQILKFYNRETELKKLNNYIFNQNIRLISVLGLSGIGKTYLVKRFVDLNLENFEVIIWKSLKYPESLDLLIDEILNICQIEIKPNNNKLNQLFDIFSNKKCLIILDDVQNIFIKGDFAGKYKPEYQNYQDFLTRITETEHQSNLILISQEECDQMCCLDEELYPVNCLELFGLNNIEILRNMGLKDEDSWLNLINLYEGNPFYLKSIGLLIKKNYDGYVADFLAENSSTGILPVNNITILPVNNITILPVNNITILPVITTQMQSHFKTIFNNLSSIEQAMVLQLSKFNQPITREDLRQSLNLNSVDFNNGLQSLQQRYLVTKIKKDKIMFNLSPVFREYLINIVVG